MVFQLPGGPLHTVYDKLNAEQQSALDAVLAEAKALNKTDGKARVAAFVGTLSDDIKNEMRELRDKYEANKAESADKVKSLSAGAQALYEKLKELAEKASISLQEEYEQTKQLLESDQAAWEELKSNKIVLPTMPVH